MHVSAGPVIMSMGMISMISVMVRGVMRMRHAIPLQSGARSTIAARDMRYPENEYYHSWEQSARVAGALGPYWNGFTPATARDRATVAVMFSASRRARQE